MKTQYITSWHHHRSHSWQQPHIIFTRVPIFNNALSAHSPCSACCGMDHNSVGSMVVSTEVDTCIRIGGLSLHQSSHMDCRIVLSQLSPMLRQAVRKHWMYVAGPHQRRHTETTCHNCIPNWATLKLKCQDLTPRTMIFPSAKSCIWVEVVSSESIVGPRS